MYVNYYLQLKKNFLEGNKHLDHIGKWEKTKKQKKQSIPNSWENIRCMWINLTENLMMFMKETNKALLMNKKKIE